MALVLIFAVILVIAVLVSELAHRSVLSTAVLFLVAGVLVGSHVIQALEPPATETVGRIAEIALFAVLFTDGMRVGLRELVASPRLPARALLVGLPLTLLFTSALAYLLTDLGWVASLLVGAILSPTDPVLVAAIVGREGVPSRLRYLLNVESGLNDGLALPIVISLLAVLSKRPGHPGQLALELALGVVIGVVIPAAALYLERTPLFSPQSELVALFPFALGLLIFAVASVTHANLFLAAFSAGVTVRTISPEFRDAFHRFGDLVTELLKLAAIFVFGTVVSLGFLGSIPPLGYVFAALTLLLARPIAIATAMVGSSLDRSELLAAAWFGPKGFASVVYGLLVAGSAITAADEIFHLVALVIVGSILLHSSTDTVIATRFKQLPQEPVR